MAKRLWFMLSVLIFPFCPSKGQDAPVAVRTVGIGATPKSSAEKAWKAFGGQTVDLSLIAYGNSKESVEIQADLFQIGSGKIAAPVKKDIPIASNMEFSQNNIQRKTTVSLQFPSVEQISDFYLRYRVRIGSEAKWQNAGSANIRLYPADLLKPIHAFAVKNLLCLYGENAILKSFLTDKEIRFEDRKDRFPKEENAPCLILAEYIDRGWFALPMDLPANQAVLVFYPSPLGLPKIIVKPAGKGILIEVKVSMLEDLASDPAAQENFLEIFNLAMAHLTAAPS
jgi:hypothetical protein